MEVVQVVVAMVVEVLVAAMAAVVTAGWLRHNRPTPAR